MLFEGIVGDLQREGSLVLFHDYRSASFFDWSGNGNNGTPNNGRLSRDGFRGNSLADKITVPHSPELVLTEGTLLVFMEPWNENAAWDGQYSWCSSKGLGTEWWFYIKSSKVRLTSSAGGSDALTIATDLNGKRYVAFNIKNGEFPALYLDGVYFGLGHAAFSFGVGTSEITIDNLHVGFTRCSANTINAFAMINRKLTAGEHYKLYSQLRNMS